MVIERYRHTQLFPLPQLKVIQLKKEVRVYLKVLPHVHSDKGGGVGGGVQWLQYWSPSQTRVTPGKARVTVQS